jgi:hypothetical protein
VAGVTDEGSQRPALAPISQVVGELAPSFARAGAVAVLLADARSLATLERRYGSKAHDDALAELGGILGAACHEIVPGRAVVARGEIGRGELVALLPCARAEGELFSKGIPAIGRPCACGSHARARAVYPFLRELPPIPIGRAYVMRNPCSPT